MSCIVRDLCDGCGSTVHEDDTYPVEIDGVTVTCCSCGVAVAVEMTTEGLVAYLQTRPAVWLAVHRTMPPVLGPWQANDRSTPPVPETAQRVRYGSAAFAVVWDRGEAYTMRWGWQAGRVNGPGFTRVERGEAVTREGAEFACDAAAIEAGVLLVDGPTARDLELEELRRQSDAFVAGLAPKEGA